MVFTPGDISSARIVAQRLVGEQADDPVEVVRHLGCVQAQDLPGALVSVALRTSGRSVDAVRQAFADGGLVRSWPMRGTLHFTRGVDIGWMCALTGPRVFAQSARRRAELGLDEAMLAHSGELAVAAIRERGPLTRAEVLELWEPHGYLEVPGRGYHLLSVLSYTGVLVQGPIRDKEQLFCVLDDLVPDPYTPAGEEALGEWATRYFTSHGPATVADFVRWTGLTVRDAKQAIAVAGDALADADIDGTRYWYDPALPDLLAEHRKEAAGLFLLPGFDELILGYKDRSCTLDPEHEQLVVPGKNGMFRPTVVLDGTVRGVWKRARGGVQTEPFPEQRFPAASRISKAAAALP
ncbi:winged helix DNA-binding domain-containing protein [Enemella sp. A6]|uniref:winged helix DNA-binding domain-containing protein n=1 Tax=Enemella sp. A6 TaxID=3440152 RepID=UPI003EBC157C